MGNNKFFLRYDEELTNTSVAKININKAKSKELRETFKKREKAERLSERDVLKLLRECAGSVIEDMTKGRGHDYFDNAFNNIAFCKYIIDILKVNESDNQIEKYKSRIIDTIANYYDPKIFEGENESEKKSYINNRYRSYLQEECWAKLSMMKGVLKDKEQSFNIVIKTYNIRNSVHVITQLFNLLPDKKPKYIWKLLVTLIEECDENIIGEILASRKRIDPVIMDIVFKNLQSLDSMEIYGMLTYYGKREKPTLIKDIGRIRVKTQLVHYLENNLTMSDEILTSMMCVVREDITLIESFDYILKNEELFKGERIYKFSTVKNKDKIKIR